MTDESRGIGGAVGPPWSVDVLADLHAGVFDDRETAELWPRVEADPDARAIIRALEATTADLAELTSAPVEPMPSDIAARIDVALADEARLASGAQSQPGVAQVVDFAAARRRRNRRLGWGAGALTVAAAAIAAIAMVVPGSDNTTPGSPYAAQPPSQGPSSGPLALRGDDLDAAIGGAMGARDFGPLGSQQRLDACLVAAGFDPEIKPAGVRSVTIDGQPAVLVVMTTGQVAQFRLVAFAPTCGPGDPGKLLDQTVGR